MTYAFRPRDLDRRLYGVFAGIVEDNDDPEHEGRVTLRLPWLDDATVTDWCRVAQQHAGNGFGAVWIPEKQTEVLVAFVHGDMTEPVVLGGSYNGKDKPPAYRDGTQQNIKMWRTKVGHEVRLDDSDGQHAVEILTAGNHSVILDDQNKQIAISSAGGSQITIDDNSKNIEIAVQGGQAKITIDATGNVTIQGNVINVSGKSISLSAASVSLGS